MRLWQNMVSGVDELRLDVALKMLKSPHFNAKMNSLKEVSVILDQHVVPFANKNCSDSAFLTPLKSLPKGECG